MEQVIHVQTVLPLTVIAELMRVTNKGTKSDALCSAVEYTIANMKPEDRKANPPIYDVEE